MGYMVGEKSASVGQRYLDGEARSDPIVPAPSPRRYDHALE